MAVVSFFNHFQIGFVTRRRIAGVDWMLQTFGGNATRSECRPRQQSFEPLSCVRQLGRSARSICVNLGADMVSNQSYDPLAIGRGHSPPAILQRRFFEKNP
jgi:hypothetical protein